jgi:GNAT superfamily N-acetyltransferase
LAVLGLIHISAPLKERGAMERCKIDLKPKMIFRLAVTGDIPKLQSVRHSVRENVLSDPALVTDEDCREYLEKRGMGWVCEMENEIVGFTIVDMEAHNIWALFVRPDFERLGIGRKLHDTLLDWYFTRTKQKIWLGTAPNTRAEIFYLNAGWKITGLHGGNEIKMEMEYDEWMGRK